jgi:hypothetical protein
MKAATCLLAVLLTLSFTSLAQTAPSPQTAPVQETAPTQQTVPTQQVAAGGESSKPEAEGQALTPPTASTPSTDTSTANVGDVLAAPSAPLFAPGAKLFIAPMNGFEQFVSDALVKKKVPVVVVNEPAKADFLVSGGAHVKRPGWITGMVLDTRGGGNISIIDARTGKPVFDCMFKRVDQGLAEGYIYQGWASNCAKRLKKMLEKK